MPAPAPPPEASTTIAERPAPRSARFDVDRLFRLWTDPVPEGEAAEAAFRELYNDPVSVNGEPVGTPELVARARALQQAIEWPDLRVLSVVDGGRQIAVVYRLRGRQVGPFDTSVGRLPATGRVVQVRTIDVLTLGGGKVREIWTVSNELTALAAIDAACLTPHASAAVAEAREPGRSSDQS